MWAPFEANCCNNSYSGSAVNHSSHRVDVNPYEHLLFMMSKALSKPKSMTNCVCSSFRSSSVCLFLLRKAVANLIALASPFERSYRGMIVER